MPKKLTQDEFIARAKQVHGDKYDYSNVVYKNAFSKVKIICPEHGMFEQEANSHLRGCGCKMCKYHGKKVYGKGIIDVSYVTNGMLSIRTWKNMLKRCYDENVRYKFPTYKDCDVCDEWLYFSNFKRWFDENYVKGYQLDKDILVKGNKIYSPNTCCFVPQEINKLLTKGDAIRGDLPLGVGLLRGKFVARISINKELIQIGLFDNPILAFEAYKQAKERHIKQVAQSYFDSHKISKKVYDALMSHEIEIKD